MAINILSMCDFVILTSPEKKRARNISFRNASRSSLMCLLFEFSFTSSFRLLFTSYAWFFIMLSLTNLLLNTGFSTVSLETTQCAIQWFVFFNCYTRHCITPNLPPVVNCASIQLIGYFFALTHIIPCFSYSSTVFCKSSRFCSKNRYTMFSNLYFIYQTLLNITITLQKHYSTNSGTSFSLCSIFLFHSNYICDNISVCRSGFCQCILLQYTICWLSSTFFRSISPINNLLPNPLFHISPIQFQRHPFPFPFLCMAKCLMSWFFHEFTVFRFLNTYFNFPNRPINSIIIRVH